MPWPRKRRNAALAPGCGFPILSLLLYPERNDFDVIMCSIRLVYCSKLTEIGAVGSQFHCKYHMRLVVGAEFRANKSCLTTTQSNPGKHLPGSKRRSDVRGRCRRR